MFESADKMAALLKQDARFPLQHLLQQRCCTVGGVAGEAWYDRKTNVQVEK